MIGSSLGRGRRRRDGMLGSLVLTDILSSEHIVDQVIELLEKCFRFKRFRNASSANCFSPCSSVEGGFKRFRDASGATCVSPDSSFECGSHFWSEAPLSLLKRPFGRRCKREGSCGALTKFSGDKRAAGRSTGASRTGGAVRKRRAADWGLPRDAPPSAGGRGPTGHFPSEW